MPSPDTRRPPGTLLLAAALLGLAGATAGLADRLPTAQELMPLPVRQGSCAHRLHRGAPICP